MPSLIWMCSLCRLPVAKNHNFGHIFNFGGLLYRLPFTDKGQIWFPEADQTSTLTNVYTYTPNFILKCSLCRLPVAKNHNFGQILNFGGSCTGSLLLIRVKFGVLKQNGRLHLRVKFHLKVFIVSASSGQKPQFWANFDFWGAPVPTPYYR